MQVIKTIAKNLGFNVTQKRRLRQSNLNFEKLNINLPRRTSVKVLQKKRQEMITSGQISVGEKIVPIEYKIMRIDPYGKMLMKINHVGRPTMVNLLKK